MCVKIYHNPKCSKSRTVLSILKEKDIDFEVIKYLETPPSFETLSQLLAELNINARGLMRTSESDYKEQGLDCQSLSEADLIQAMIDTPKLIERPIVKTKKGTIIGRPPENILLII